MPDFYEFFAGGGMARAGLGCSTSPGTPTRAPPTSTTAGSAGSKRTSWIRFPCEGGYEGFRGGRFVAPRICWRRVSVAAPH